MESDIITLQFGGDKELIEEIVQKIDPTANTFDCYCSGKSGLGPGTTTQTHVMTCSWCRGNGTYEISFKLIDGELRKVGYSNYMGRNYSPLYDVR